GLPGGLAAAGLLDRDGLSLRRAAQLAGAALLPDAPAGPLGPAAPLLPDGLRRRRRPGRRLRRPALARRAARLGPRRVVQRPRLLGHAPGAVGRGAGSDAQPPEPAAGLVLDTAGRFPPYCAGVGRAVRVGPGTGLRPPAGGVLGAGPRIAAQPAGVAAA